MGLKFIMSYLLIFIMIVMGDQVNPLIAIEEKDVGACSKKAELIWQFSRRYFKDMRAVSIFGLVDLSDEIMKCSMRDPELPVQYNASIWSFARRSGIRKLKQGEPFYHHEMNGFILMKESIENIELIIPPIDPETKVTMIFTNVSKDDVSNIFMLAWNQYKILDLVIFRLAQTRNIIQGETLDLFVSVYDPFIIKNGARGLVHTFLMKDDGDLLTNKLMKIMNNRLINVNRYPLKVVTNDNNELESKECDFPQCEITLAIVKTMNFDPVYHEVGFGEALPEVEYGDADMTAKTIFVAYYGQYYSVFLWTIEYQKQAFITPKMRPSFTVSFIKVFCPTVSLALALSYIAMVIATRCLHEKYHGLIKNKVLRNGRGRMDFVKICCVTLGNFLLVSQPGGGEKRYECCLLISWLLFSMVICCSYQGTMVEHLTAGGPSRDINTMEELAESNLKILLTEIDANMIQAAATDKEAPQFFRHILKHLEVMSLSDLNNAGKRVAADKDTAIMCNIESCKFYKLRYYSSETGETIHIVKEGLFSGYTSLMVPLNSPYKERINEILMKILESGLLQKWQRNSDNKSDRFMLIPRVYNPEPRNDVYRMKDLSFIFWSWLGCCCFCFIIFLAELLWAYIFTIMDEATITFLAIFSR